MADALIEVKVEPNDDNEDFEYEEAYTRLQEQQEEQQQLVAQTPEIFSTATTTATALVTVKVEDELDIKTEFDVKQEAESPEEEDENSNMDDINTLSLVGLDDMQVVDEQPDIITLSAATNKSEDEQNFMLSCLAKAKPARKRKQTFYKKTCEQCKDTFHTRRIYEQHIQFGLCNLLQTKLCCSVCPLTFSLQAQLDTHLDMHRLNRFFCTKNCGQFFITLEECKLHEYRQHKVRRIVCTVCQHKFTSVKAWSQHMNIHSGLERFVCSFCYTLFESSMELAKHWKLHANTCGRLMQSLSDTIESVETTSTQRIGGLSKGTQGDIREDFASVSDTPAAKRAKVDVEDCQQQAGIDYLSLNDVELKEEPLSDNEIPDDLESVLTNPTSNNESEVSSVFIKSEPCDSKSDNVEIKEEPQFDDDNGAVMPSPVPTVNHPGFRVIPVSSILAAKQPSSGQPQQQIPNLRLVRLQQPPSIQQPGLPAIGQTVGLKPLQIQNQNIQIPPIKAFKIFKIIPNTKMIRLPSGAIASRTKITTNMSITSAPKPIFLRLKPTQSVQSAAVVNLNAPSGTTKATTQPQLLSSLPYKPAPLPPKTVKSEQKPIVVHLSSLGVSTSIDAEDLKRLVIEAEAAKNSAEASSGPAPRRNTCKSKIELAMIERIPQKRALIENWKQQVKQFEMPLNTNDNKADDGTENSDVKLETNLDSSQAEVKLESKPTENLFTKLAIKQDLKLLTNKEFLAALIDKSNNKLPNFVLTKNNLIQNSNEKIVESNAGDDDDEDDCESKSLVIDEDANNSNSSFGSKKEVVITTAENVTNEPPPIFYLPVTTECDPELQATRKLYPHLRYQWRCPRCPRTYAQKHSFRGHLVSAHGMCQEEFAKLIVEVKPSQSAKSLEELKISPKKPLRANSESETESNSTMDSNSNITDTTTTTANKPPARTNRTNTKLTCAKCGRVCSTRTALNDHILANCSREPQYPCTVCPKRFFSSSTLNQHMSIHTGALPYKCNYCDKRFRTRGQVTVHHRTHTGERPFECQVCGQCFTHRETLISHLSRHIGMKRYKCYGCNQQFACISGLKTHREVRFSSCGQVKLNTRAIGPRVRVIKGNVIFEAQPEINPYLRTEDPQEVLAEVQNKVKN